MVKEYRYGLMEVYIKVNGKIIKQMEMVNYFIIMEIDIKECL